MGRRPGIIISSSIYAGDLLIAQTEQTSKSDFDLSAWENLNGYRYDKFEKAWVYQRNYVKYYDDANLIISIYCSGNDEGITVFPAIVLRLIDLTDNSASGRSAYFMYTGMSILIGDDLYVSV